MTVIPSGNYAEDAGFWRSPNQSMRATDDGNSIYITEGNLQASNRTLGSAPYDNLGLPYHRHYESDLESIPTGEPIELVFDLLATSYVFRAGSHIRIAVTFADAGNFDTLILDPALTLSLLRNERFPSFVELPLVDSR